MQQAMYELPLGPKEPAIVQAVRWMYRPIEFMDDCSRRFGPWFTVRFPRGLPVVFTASPEAAKDVFAGDPENLLAGEGMFFLKPVLGENSLLVLDGSAHRRARRLMMPPFHGERMKAYGRTIGALAKEHMARWPRNRPMRMHQALQSLTLDVILATVFGLSEGERLRRLRENLITLLDSTTRPTDLLLGYLFLGPEGKPPLAALQERLGSMTPWGRFVGLRRRIDEILFAEISDRRRAGVGGGDDVLSLLIATRDQDGRPLSDQELRDELMTLLLAGHETSASALCWIFFRLAAHPDVSSKLREEIRAASDGARLEPERLMDLPYLDGVINETLRLHPLFPFVWRVLRAPMQLGGRALPAGVAIAPSIYLIHRSPAVWSDPERFEPERFARSRPAPWEFLPFGGGGRRCLGMAFAQYEMKVILGHFLKSLGARTAPGYVPKITWRGHAFAPADGMPLILEDIMIKDDKDDPAVPLL